MTSLNSFGAAGQLHVGGRTLPDFPPRRPRKNRRQSLAHSLFDQDPSRKPAALRRRHHRQALRHRIRRQVGHHSRPRRRSTSGPARVVLQDFTGVPCVVDLAAMRDALKKMGADPKKANPLVPVGSGHRPLRAGRSLRHQRRISVERAAGISAQSGALFVPALGPVRVSEFPRGPAGHRHRASGESRIPSVGSHDAWTAPLTPTP